MFKRDFDTIEKNKDNSSLITRKYKISSKRDLSVVFSYYGKDTAPCVSLELPNVTALDYQFTEEEIAQVKDLENDFIKWVGNMADDLPANRASVKELPIEVDKK